MNISLSALLLASVLLTACQTTTNSLQQTQSTSKHIQQTWQNLPQTQAEFDAKTVQIRRTAQGKAVQKTLYFDANWQPVAQKDPQGFYRQSYGLQDNGLYLMQDFYGNGKPQTALFYGTQPENTYSGSARGFLATYKPDGTLETVWYNVNDEFYSNINLCGSEICSRFDQRDTRFTETVFKQGKTLAVRSFENDVLARYEAFYPNGKTAYLIEARDFGNPKTYRISQQYYLPSGEKSARKPTVAEFAQLERDVLVVEQQAYQREAGETAWQDAVEGYPLIKQQIDIIRRDGGY